jgi:hypothetical protein
MSEHSNAPAKNDVIQTLQLLIRGEISREDVSDWARPWITRLHEIDDEDVRNALDSLSGADSPTTDRRYLYGQEDFENWLRDLHC